MKSSRSPIEKMPFSRGKVVAPQARGESAPSHWISPELYLTFARGGTNAHRLASGGPRWLERFDHDLLLSYQTDRARDLGMAEIQERCGVYGFSPARLFGKYLPQQAAERSAPILLWEETKGSMETEVVENQVRYGLDFAGGYSAGLFIDQRANRTFVRELKPKRLLNTFAYTCSFSVVAALSGAETMSIDLSRRSLTRGEENFHRNGLNPKAGHQFLADDVLAVLPRLGRRGEKFDVLILDPPTFSRNQKGAAFQVQRDFEQLVTLALEVAAPGASLLLSVNHSAMRVADLERIARSSLRLQNRSGRFFQTEPLPDFPIGSGAKTIWIKVN